MRLTSRGWWFLMLVLGLLAVGLIGNPTIHGINSGLFRLGRVLPERASALLGLPSSAPRAQTGSHIPLLILPGLTLFCWFAWEWLLFALRSRFAVRGLRLDRTVRDERGRVENLWAGRKFRVDVELSLHGGLPLPFLALADRIPFGTTLSGGESQVQGSLQAGEPLRLAYRLLAPHAGRVRFDGVRLQLADLQGFFYKSLFVAAPVEYRVLPVLSDEIGQPATQKRHNLLPPPGVHRLRRPGSGSELLDLRDYLPGDPPKTIAWKVSARRDRLITKEFESEVPVRCTLFLDTSNSVRLGPAGKKSIGHLVEIGAAIIQANASIRDLTGLCLFDEKRSSTMRPARTARHVADVMNRLADAAGLAPAQGSDSLEALMRVAYPFADETYPELMDNVTNRTPFWLARQWPVSAHTGSPISSTRRIVRALSFALASILFVLLAVVEWAAIQDRYDSLVAGLRGNFDLPEDYFNGMDDILGWVFLVLTLFVYRPFVRFFTDGIPVLVSAHRRRLARWRKRLSALLAVQHDLGPGGLALLMEDNELFSFHVQQFLAEHHVPYQPPLYDERGHYQFAAPEKIAVLAKALLHAVGKGQDNELFVLLVDLLELSEHLEPLLAATRVAVARHHSVVVFCPWPHGVEQPQTAPTQEEGKLATVLGSGHLGRLGSMIALRPLVTRILGERLHSEFNRVRRAFARMGVPVVCAEQEESIAMVLERLERLRGVRRRR